MSGSKLLSLEEVAKAYNYSKEELLDLVKKKLLPCIIQEPNPGQFKFLFPDRELSQKLIPRPATAAVPIAVEPGPEPEEEAQVDPYYPKARSEKPVSPPAEKPKPAKKSAAKPTKK